MEEGTEQRPVGLEEGALLLQATLRMQLARRAWRRRGAAICIQRHARGAAARRERLRAPQLLAALLRARQRQRPLQQRLQEVSELQESGVPSQTLQGLRDECSDLGCLVGLLHAVRLRSRLSALAISAPKAALEATCCPRRRRRPFSKAVGVSFPAVSSLPGARHVPRSIKSELRGPWLSFHVEVLMASCLWAWCAPYGCVSRPLARWPSTAP